MPTNIFIKNSNQRNQLKVTTEVLSEVEDTKTKKKEKIWNTPIVTYLKAGEGVDVWVGETRRFSVQEMPT